MPAGESGLLRTTILVQREFTLKAYYRIFTPFFERRQACLLAS